MPIAEADPWRKQYFEGVACPDDVLVPTEDGDAYMWYPEHRWIYNKLEIAESQRVDCAPHGFAPTSFPVFSKPIYNMRGMGAGSQVFHSYEDYLLGQLPGHMWMEMLEGEHVSTDVAVVDGDARWWRHVVGQSIGDGVFDYWTIEGAHRPELEAYIDAWLAEHLKGYTGMANFETIGGRIIEGHLRFSDQWPDLYGSGWVDALVKLYADKEWNFEDSDRRDGYSVVLFGAHGVSYTHPPKEAVDALRARDDVSSIQITFHEDRAPEAHSMPPGGFRLAIVNTHDLAAGQAVREKLAL
ncbi:MAG: hypothetical protein JJ899_17705, partial [Alphaproteobacteria bacterium]|nr:hypothetical protein [Alphaproteobacteria bacterium]